MAQSLFSRSTLFCSWRDSNFNKVFLGGFSDDHEASHQSDGPPESLIQLSGPVLDLRWHVVGTAETSLVISTMFGFEDTTVYGIATGSHGAQGTRWQWRASPVVSALVASQTELAPVLVLSVSFLSLVQVSFFKLCPKGAQRVKSNAACSQKCGSQSHEVWKTFKPSSYGRSAGWCARRYAAGAGELKFEPRLLVGVATRGGGGGGGCRVVLLRVGGRGTRLHPSAASPSVSSLCVGAHRILLCCVSRGKPPRLRTATHRRVASTSNGGFEVPQTISFYFGVRVVVSGFAPLRRCVLSVEHCTLWVAIVSVMLIVREAVLAQCFGTVRATVGCPSLVLLAGEAVGSHGLAVRRWCFLAGEAVGSTRRRFEVRTVAEGNRKLFNCIEDSLTPRDAEESFFPLPRVPSTWNSWSGKNGWSVKEQMAQTLLSLTTRWWSLTVLS